MVLLGCGAFGDTWRAADSAVKIICVDNYPVERIKREVGGLSRVSSPYIVKLKDVRQVQLGGATRTALYFEYISGRDIQERLDQGKMPSTAEAITLLQGLLRGVQELHKVGTIHRDIKPANMALRNDDWSQPVLLDLGLARSFDDTTITVYPGRVGTPAYMAPEQIEGRRARKAADLFAVGVATRTIIANEHPFYPEGHALSIDEALQLIRSGPKALPSEVPQAVRELLDRLVSSAEHDRGSAGSSLRRLNAAIRNGRL